jgi:hypothetical protein
MTYKILEMDGLQRRTVAKNLATIDTAKAFLEGWGNLIAFDLDPDGYDAADAALQRYKTGALQVFAIERED